jgi:hypothetical protein
MTGLPGLSTIQKLRYFLAGVFPALSNSGGAVFARWLQRYPRIADLSDRARTSAVGVSVRRLTSTFVLGSYAAEDMDWAKLPNEAAPVLRIAIVAAAVLCLTVPLTVLWIWPALSAQAITGAAEPPVAGWSVVLWLVALSLAWSCLLLGTAAANRIVFLPSVAMFLYFSAVMVAALPKSWWSLLAPAQAALAVVYSGTRLGRLRWAALREVATAIAAGALIAALAIVVIPTAPWYRGRLVSAALSFGAPLGLGLTWIARRLRQRQSAPAPALRSDVVVAVTVCTHLLLLASLAVRGGLTIPAGGIRTLSIQMTGYLWPLYLFVGAGVVFKVLRRTHTVQSVAQTLLPSPLFVSLTFAVLVAATLVPWVEPVLLTPAGPWPAALSGAASGVYRATSWLWASQLMRYTMATMKWVLLASLIVAAWMLVRRRLTSSTMAGILFIVAVVGFGVFEYHFQLNGFGRSPRNSALSLLIFSALVLWLVHKTVLKHVFSSSRWWPQAARVALYAALLMFVLLPIHARVAMHDRAVSNEIFLYLFTGVINFGVPYYLYLFATRRFAQMPLSPSSALGLFCLGGVLAVPLIIADKSVLAGSVSAAWSAAHAQAQGVLAGQPVLQDRGFFPAAWIVIRGVLAIGGVLLVAWVVQQRVRDNALAPAAVACAVIAVAAGVACFSNRGVELPLLPQRVVYFIAPLGSSSIVDASLVARQLSFLLPALLLALAFTGSRGRTLRIAGVAGAITLHVFINLIWPLREVWLRSSGAMFSIAGAALVLLFFLAAALCRRLDQVLLRRSDDGAGPVIEPGSLLTWAELRVAGAVLLIAFAAVGSYKAYAQRLAVRRIPGTAFELRVPAPWSAAEEDAGVAVFSRPSWTDTRPSLRAELRSHTPDSTRELLRDVALEAAQHLANFEAKGLETLERYYPGALALDYRYLQRAGDESMSALGTIALAPMPNGRALILTVVHAPSEPERRWDVLRVLQKLPR